VILRIQSAKKPDLNWNDLRHILAVARARALAPAARQLGVNETTVARRIARAEHSLGSKLFDRIEGAMVPTEAGEIAVERAERLEVEVDFLGSRSVRYRRIGRRHGARQRNPIDHQSSADAGIAGPLRRASTALPASDSGAAERQPDQKGS
jgi:Bacterial regulatory helix-turn-helix protein, lysR family